MPSSDLEVATEKTVSQHEVDSKETSDPALEFPDGGIRAWLVVLGVWLMQFSTFGYTNAFGVYNDFYNREYLSVNYTSSQISWVGSVQLLLTLSMGLVSGRGFDVGYFWHMMIGGAVLFVFSLFMLSLSKPEQFYQIFLAQGLGQGIAIGITYVPGLAIVAHWFRKKRAVAMGIAATGSAVGGVLHPIMLNAWFHGRLGFHNGVRASAGLNLGILAISLLCMKTRLPFDTSKSRSLLSGFKLYLRDLPYVITVMGTFLTLTGLYFPIFFLQLNAITNGINETLAFYLLAILNAGSVVGRVVPNLFVRRFGVYNVLIPCVLLCAALIFCALAVKVAASTVVFALIFGFLSGGYVGLLAPMIGSLARRDSEIGERMGVCFTFTGIGGLIGPPIAGALLSQHFHWWRPIVFAGTCVIGGCLCFTTTRFLKSRERQTQIL